MLPTDNYLVGQRAVGKYLFIHLEECLDESLVCNSVVVHICNSGASSWETGIRAKL